MALLLEPGARTKRTGVVFLPLFAPLATPALMWAGGQAWSVLRPDLMVLNYIQGAATTSATQAMGKMGMNMVYGFLADSATSVVAGGVVGLCALGAAGLGAGRLLGALGPAGLTGAMAPITTTTTTPAAAAPAAHEEEERRRRLMHDQLVAQGAGQRQRLPPLTLEQSGMALLVLGAFLSYLEYVGVQDVRHMLLARAEAQKLKTAAPGRRKRQTADDESAQASRLVDQGAEGIDASMVGLLLESQTDVLQLSEENVKELRGVFESNARRRGGALKDDAEYEGEEGGVGGLAGWLRNRLSRLYEAEPYYYPSDEGVAKELKPPQQPSAAVAGAPLRILVNLWLGVLVTARVLDGKGDGLHRLGQLGSLWVYWEVFVYALRLYGWSAVHRSLSLVVRELMLAAPQQATIKEPAAAARRKRPDVGPHSPLLNHTTISVPPPNSNGTAAFRRRGVFG